jgi:hypothetical protein
VLRPASTCFIASMICACVCFPLLTQTWALSLFLFIWENFALYYLRLEIGILRIVSCPNRPHTAGSSNDAVKAFKFSTERIFLIPGENGPVVDSQKIRKAKNIFRTKWEYVTYVIVAESFTRSCRATSAGRIVLR